MCVYNARTVHTVFTVFAFPLVQKAAPRGLPADRIVRYRARRRTERAERAALHRARSYETTHKTYKRLMPVREMTLYENDSATIAVLQFSR